jgi:hypothetical protein
MCLDLMGVSQNSPYCALSHLYVIELKYPKSKACANPAILRGTKQQATIVNPR